MSTTPQSHTQATLEPSTQQPWLWNVVLLNDDEHTVEYVVAMMQELFAHPVPKGVAIAKKVDTDGRAVVLTTHKELAELKQEQIHAYGRDKLAAECAGAMSAIIEPAEFGGDDSDSDAGADEPGNDLMPDRPLVIQTEHLDPAAAAWLAQRCELMQCSSDDPKFNDLLPRADGLLIRTYTNVNAATLARAPQLKVVARAGVGLDNVDVDACLKRSVVVVSTPGANTRAVIELVTAYTLDALRPRTYLPRALDKDAWNRTRKDLIAPRQLCDLTLGIIGLGRVGSGLARVGAAMDMRVLYHDLIAIPESHRFGAEPSGLDQVLRESDVLSIHVDGRAENRHIINAAALASCRPSVILINTSRGFVIDPAALAAFLKLHAGATAILDVHEPEPFGPDYPLLGLPNAKLTPHIGAATATAHANMSWVVKDLWRVLTGEKPEHPAAT